MKETAILSPEGLKKALAWLQAKNLLAACPFCSSPDWDLGPIGTLGVIEGEGAISSTQGYPTLPLVCKQCGFIRLVSATKMGVYPTQTE